MAGARGPVPKRSEARTRRNKEPEGDVKLAKGTSKPSSWPPASERWDELAVDWYHGLRDSGMAEYYEQSDIEMARIIAGELSHYLKSYEGKRSAMMFAALMTAMSSLGVTEGDRRRMRIELEKPKEAKVSASVVAIADYQKALGVT
jgi:hypothetical protein